MVILDPVSTVYPVPVDQAEGRQPGPVESSRVPCASMLRRAMVQEPGRSLAS